MTRNINAYKSRQRTMLAISIRDVKAVGAKTVVFLSSWLEHGAVKNAKQTERPPAKATPARRLSPIEESPLSAAEDRLLDLFARNMKLVRLARDYSQEELAHLCGLDRTFVSSVERVGRNLSIRNIQKIADGLDVDVRHLFDPALDLRDIGLL